MHILFIRVFKYVQLYLLQVRVCQEADLLRHQDPIKGHPQLPTKDHLQLLIKGRPQLPIKGRHPHLIKGHLQRPQHPTGQDLQVQNWEDFHNSQHVLEVNETILESYVF